MHIHCLGLNHRTAEVNLRERLAFSEERARTALARLGCGRSQTSDPCQDGEPFSEMVILSTCNRVEIYALSPNLCFEALEGYLSDVQGVRVEEFHSHVYRLADEKAVAHLFRVAAGLDSLVLGEPQILGQVMEAFELASSQLAVGPVLSRLFRAALHTGKRARAETAISKNPASISSVAIQLAETSLHDLPSACVAVVGAGEMAELAIEALRKRGVSQVRVVNRTLERARMLAERWGGQAATFEQLPEALAWADIVVASTGAPHTIIHPPMVSDAMAGRKERPLVLIDIAVPRDVDMEVGRIPGIRLFDIDTLHDTLEIALARRTQEVPQVEDILAEEQAEFMGYLKTLDVIPLIADLRRQAEEIRQAELEKTLRRLQHLTPEDRERLDLLTEALVKKLLHAPITRLRSEAGSPKAAETAATARSLFGL